MLDYKSLFLIMIGAQDVAELSEKVKNFLNQISSSDDIRQICIDTINNSKNCKVRVAAYAKTKQELQTKLQNWQANNKSPDVEFSESAGTLPKTAFIFTGQGSQVSGMGKLIYESNQTFKSNLDECARILGQIPEFDKPLFTVLWGEDKSIINQTQYAQPALFAFEYALYKLMLEIGVTPQAVLGHSVGEYIAATIAGVMSLEDGLKLITLRANLMQALPHNGAMLMLKANKQQVENQIAKYKDKVSIAGINAPNSIVISGESDAVNAISEIMENQGIETVALVVSHAFHSHLMDPMLDKFRNAFSAISLHNPVMDIITNLTGKPCGENEMSSVDYWIKHTRNPVQYASSIEYLLDNGYHFFLEIGTHPVLTQLGKQTLTAWLATHSSIKDIPVFIVTQDRYEQSLETMCKCFAKLYTQGFDLKIDKILS